MPGRILFSIQAAGRHSVNRDNKTLFEDAYTTHYMPWRAVHEYGPGTKGMPPKEGKNKDGEG